MRFPIKYVTGGEPGRGRGVAGVGRDLEASKCTGVNWYIITLTTRKISHQLICISSVFINYLTG